MINEEEAQHRAREVFGAIKAERAARKQVKDQTYKTVQLMRAQLRNRDFAEGYMAGVTTGMDLEVVRTAYECFEEAWEETATPE